MHSPIIIAKHISLIISFDSKVNTPVLFAKNGVIIQINVRQNKKIASLSLVFSSFIKITNNTISNKSKKPKVSNNILLS